MSGDCTRGPRPSSSSWPAVSMRRSTSPATGTRWTRARSWVLMMLAAGPGSSIEISAEGVEAEPAVKALADLVAAKFDEER